MTTQETIKKAVDYAKENNIKNIVVATTTGGNLTYLEDEKDLHIVPKRCRKMLFYIFWRIWTNRNCG